MILTLYIRNLSDLNTNLHFQAILFKTLKLESQLFAFRVINFFNSFVFKHNKFKSEVMFQGKTQLKTGNKEQILGD